MNKLVWVDIAMSVLREERISKFIRGDSRLAYSSAGLEWSGFHLEQHQFDPGERSSGELNGLLLCLWNNPHKVRCDHPDAFGNFVPKLVPPGTLSLYTAGPLSPVRLASPVSGLFCVFDRGFLAEALEGVRKESNLHSVADGVVLQDKRCFLDRSLQQILSDLGEEARRRGETGRLYADECIQAFADRLAFLLNNRESHRWSRHRLDTYAFKRLCDQVRCTPSHELNLAALAADSGYSKRHLIRSFRAKTGRTPYQYLVDLRLEKARRLMLKTHLSLLQIALECDFSSHAHFTRAFVQRLGMQPSYFRKNL